jgi:hypothetical protein
MNPRESSTAKEDNFQGPKRGRVRRLSDVRPEIDSCQIKCVFWRGLWDYYMICAIDGILSRTPDNWKNTKIFEHFF